MENNNKPGLNFEKKDGFQPAGLDKAQEFVEKFKALPKGAQFASVGVVLFFVLMISGGDNTPQQQEEQVQAEYNERAGTTEDSVEAAAKEDVKEDEASFQAVDPTRASLQRGFYTQQRKELAELKENVVSRVDTGLQDMTEIREAVTSQQRQMQQMIDTFNAQIRTFEESNTLQKKEISKLVEQARQQEYHQKTQAIVGMQSPSNAAEPKQPKRKARISQTSLGGRGSAGYANSNQALLSFSGRNGAKSQLNSAVTNPGGNASAAQGLSYVEKRPEPFLPPLGFVKATLLNGFDALVGGATPALVRFKGVYKTAMNSTVNLDGCIGFLEFEGDISTERAIGKPSRMTCVYPDRGAVTYELTGYVVDAQDGIVGIPGIFYEGDASRVAAAMLADFTAGIGSVVRENQFSEETADGGVARNLTGSAVESEIASGVENLMGGLRDYLFERANRIVPFVRVDPTRDLHIVLLSGFELRDEGSPWTVLVRGETADQYNETNAKAKAEAEEKMQQGNQ